VNAQLPLLVVPGTVAEHVTVCVPTAKIVPEGGLQTTTAGPQAPWAVTAKFTLVLHEPKSAFTVMGAGHWMVGGWSGGRTVTVNEQVLVVAPLGAVAVQVTVWVPTLKTLPEGGLQVTVAGPQAPCAVGAKVTTVLQEPRPAVAVTDAGHCIEGAWSGGRTVTRKEQVLVLVPLGAVDVQVTV
jgi:hypothetical protein